MEKKTKFIINKYKIILKTGFLCTYSDSKKTDVEPVPFLGYSHDFNDSESENDSGVKNLMFFAWNCNIVKMILLEY